MTWFSINNISNLKELTEKKIIEEERELFFRLQETVRTKLVDVTAGVSGDFRSPGILKDSLLNIRINNKLFPSPFIVNESGDLVFPNFIKIEEIRKEGKSSDTYVNNFAKAQAEEFIKKDYVSAEKYLLTCLNQSSGAGDSVKALNVLARIYIKSNQLDKALEEYDTIISKFYSESAPDGLPIAYFAISQLIKIKDPSNTEKILSLLDSCLGRIEQGAIPLSYSTENLLNGVQQWIANNKPENNIRVEKVNNLLADITDQIHFVYAYGDAIKEFLADSQQDPEQISVNGFLVKEIFNAERASIMMLNIDYEFPFGFVIGNEKLFAPLTDSEYQLDYSYQYLVEFPDLPNPNNTFDKLIYSAQLNPYLPGQEIQIKLVDENVIAEFVSRRSYIYGIAVALLLLGMVLGIVLILRDLSREKRLSQLQADFTSNVTHELKTPITSIYLFAESMFFDKLKSRSEEKEYLSIIMKESERLKRMINNILEYSKMEKGKHEYHFAETDLSALVKLVSHEMNYWFAEKNLSISMKIEDNISLLIDREKIMQALSNLLSNAIKFSEEGKSINIELSRKAGHTILAVEDEGIGIPKDQQSKIFDKFYRVAQKETESISGTGLGLTVVKEIVEAHGGKIIVDSEVGKGSKFSIILDNKIQAD